MFTQCADDRQQQAFITALRAAAGAGHGPGEASAALVVLGGRADFEPLERVARRGPPTG